MLQNDSLEVTCVTQGLCWMQGALWELTFGTFGGDECSSSLHVHRRFGDVQLAAAAEVDSLRPGWTNVSQRLAVPRGIERCIAAPAVSYCSGDQRAAVGSTCALLCRAGRVGGVTAHRTSCSEFSEAAPRSHSTADCGSCHVDMCVSA